MKNIIKTSLISIATCAVLFSLQGCGKDRAGVTPAEAKKMNPTSVPELNNAHCGEDTDDYDCDYLPDVDEKRVGTAVDDPDSDDDGIIDGCEVGVDELSSYKNCGITEPMNPDTDGDGLVDGDEVGDISKKYPLKEKSPYITDPRKDSGYDTDDDDLKDGDEVLLDKYKTDPTNPDTDKDGLKDSDELGRGLSPKNSDKDGDGLSDGYEVKVSGTDPEEKDSDKDGVTDGIEVCGTFDSNKKLYEKDNDQKVVKVANSIDIKELSDDFYDDVLDVPHSTTSIDDDRPIRKTIWVLEDGKSVEKDFGDYRCQKPADTNNDPDGDIDALDPTNDSDLDQRPNNVEHDKDKTDPLNGGKAPLSTELNDDTREDIQNKAYAPWITQTPDGDKLVKAGFVYVPKAKHDGDKYGFWMSKYLAVFADSNDNSVKFVKGNDKVDSVSVNEAKDLINNSDLPNVNATVSLPTFKNFEDLLDVKISVSNGCVTVKNTVNDKNMPASYENIVCEFVPDEGMHAYELAFGSEVDVESDPKVKQINNTSGGNGVHFRAATGYQK